MKKDILMEDIPYYEEDYQLEEGIYYARIVDVTATDNDSIKVEFELEFEDGTNYTLFLKTNRIPKNHFDMINRLVDACGTRKPKEFIGKEVYISVIIVQSSKFRRFENVQDVVSFDENDEENLILTEKGYFFR